MHNLYWNLIYVTKKSALSIFIIAITSTTILSQSTPKQDEDGKKQLTPNSQIEINFNDLDLISLVDLISKATGTSFLYEDNLKASKKINLISTGSYKIKDAYRIFENILDINNYTTIKEGPYTRIISKNEARTNQSPIVEQAIGSVIEGDYVTMVLEIKSTSVSDIRSAITPFLSPTTLLNQYSPSNILIIRDSRRIVEKIVELVNVLDRKNEQLQIGRYPLINLDVNKVVAILTDIYVKDAKNKVYLHVDAANNTIIALATKFLQNLIATTIRNLDQGSVDRNYDFYELRYISTKEAIDLSGYLFPQSAAGKAGGSSVNIINNARANQLILFGPQSEVEKLKKFLKSIDTPLSQTGSSYKVFKLSNSNSDNIAQTLQQVTKSVSSVASSIDATDASLQSNTSTSSNKDNGITIVSDAQTNSLVIFAEPREMELIDVLIQKLDIPQAQVFLEVMIVEVSLDKSLNLGIDWKGAGQVGEALIGAGLGGSSNFLPTTADSLATAGQGAQVGVLGPNITYQGQNFSSYSAFIEAINQDSDFNLISNPQILTVSNQEATIKVGEVRPFQTSARVDSNNNVITNYEYKEVGVTLKFTARIGENDSILLKIDQSTKNVKTNGNNGINLTPTTFERNITTNILAQHQEIVVLGGLISENSTDSQRSNYCLGDIPVLGWLFKNTSQQSSKTNLLVYIKPAIVRNFDERQEILQYSQSYFNQANQSDDLLQLVDNKFETQTINSGQDIENFMNRGNSEQ